MDFSNNVEHWYEQRSFSEQFFNLGWLCRQTQAREDCLGWKKILEAKYSACAGVMSEKQLEKFDDKRDVISSLVAEFQNNKDYKIYNLLYEELLKFERELDSIVNEKMPFIFRNKKRNISEGVNEKTVVEFDDDGNILE